MWLSTFIRLACVQRVVGKTHHMAPSIHYPTSHDCKAVWVGLTARERMRVVHTSARPAVAAIQALVLRPRGRGHGKAVSCGRLVRQHSSYSRRGGFAGAPPNIATCARARPSPWARPPPLCSLARGFALRTVPPSTPPHRFSPCGHVHTPLLRPKPRGGGEVSKGSESLAVRTTYGVRVYRHSQGSVVTVQPALHGTRSGYMSNTGTGGEDEGAAVDETVGTLVVAQVDGADVEGEACAHRPAAAAPCSWRARPRHAAWALRRST